MPPGRLIAGDSRQFAHHARAPNGYAAAVGQHGDLREQGAQMLYGGLLRGADLQQDLPDAGSIYATSL